MSNHVWRQGHGISPFREWIRRELPGASEGFVFADMDLAERRYGQSLGLDSVIGDMMLMEEKEAQGRITEGEKRIYDWFDNAIKASIPTYRDRWRGWHVLHIAHSIECPLCPTCGQPTQNAALAYQRFCEATLTFDNQIITHEELKVLLGYIEIVKTTTGMQPELFNGRR